MAEMPAMARASYSSSSIGVGDIAGVMHQHSFVPTAQVLAGSPMREAVEAMAQAHQKRTIYKKEEPMPDRYVQVLIADIALAVPVADRLIYRGEPIFTDLTDQELFFEIDIKKLLDEHNVKRGKIVNKAVKDRTEYLEPARIRDLKMVVVQIAQF